MDWINFWKLLAGLGIFLFGMAQLEESLKDLAGRTFKLFLKKHTDNRLKAILNGTIITAFLQSSSVVTLIVLGFVGAGVISMRNALAVVFGSNLGTTLDSWVVATLGFKLNLESLSLPIIAISGVGLTALTGNKKIYQIFKFTMGFGLLFLGLGFMKESIEVLIHDFDFARYQNLNRLGFVFIGFVITAIIQSSSATMVIVLSALNTAAIPFEIAVSVIIGSELGTSVKTVLASINGIAAKRRVALGNIIFNIIITIFAYLFTFPLIHFIQTILGFADPLIGLVMFQTLINLFGIILFFPFLKQFSDFLEKRFVKTSYSATRFIRNVSPLVPESVLEALENETLLFIHRIVTLNMETFHIDDISLKNPVLEKMQDNDRKSYNDKYEDIKQAAGEILSVYTKISSEKIEKPDFLRMNQLVSSVRNAMYSGKGIKDIRQDRKELSESTVDSTYEQYQFIKMQLRNFYLKVNEILMIKDQSFRFEELAKQMIQNGKDYEIRTSNIYSQSAQSKLNEYDASTLLNVSREVYSSCKALTISLKDYLLDASLAETFDDLPTTK